MTRFFIVVFTLICFLLINTSLVKAIDIKDIEAQMRRGAFEAVITDLEKMEGNQSTLYQIFLLESYVLTKKNQQADSLLSQFTMSTDDLYYPNYCLLQSKLSLNKKKDTLAFQFLQEGLIHLQATHPQYCTLTSDFLETEGNIYYQRRNLPKAKELLVAALNKRFKCEKQYYKIVKSYNNCFQVAYFTSDYTNALSYVESASSLLPQLDPAQMIRSQIWNNKGVIHKKLGDFQAAKDCYMKSLALKKQQYKEPLHIGLVKAYNNITNVYSMVEDISNTMAYLDTLELILERNGENADILTNVYLNRAYYELDYQAQEAYLLKIIDLAPDISNEGQVNLVKAYNNLGVLMSRQGVLVEAENYYSQALKALENIPSPPKEYIANIYFNLAIIAEQRKQYEEAENYVRIGLQQLKTVFGDQHFKLADQLGALGVLYQKKGDVKEAESYLLQAMELCRSNYGAKHPHTATMYRKLASFYLKNSDLPKAADYAQQAIGILKVNPVYRLYHLPAVYQTLAIALEKQGQIEAAEATQIAMLEAVGFSVDKDGHIDPTPIPDYHLAIAFNTYKYYLKSLTSDSLRQDPLADQFIDIGLVMINRMRSNFFFETSTFEFKKSIKSVVDILIQDRFKQWETTGMETYLEQWYILSETYKSGALDLPFLRKQAHFKQELPINLIKKEKEMLYQYEKAFQEYQQLLEQTNQGLMTLDSTVWNNLTQWQAKKTAFIQELKENHPDYYRERYATNVVSFEKLKTTVAQTKRTYISNYWGETDNITLFIDADTSFLFSTPLDSINHYLTPLLKEFSSGTQPSDGPSFLEKRKQLIQQLNQLSTFLVAPIRPFINKEDFVCIIPDNKLCYLPYDILFSKTVDTILTYRALPYLIRQLNLSYDASIALNLRKHSKVEQKPYNYIGFAPTAAKIGTNEQGTFRGNKATLFTNVQEIERAKDLFGGLAYLGASATKELFLEKANQASIIHLAMHGQANDEVAMHSTLFFSTTDTNGLGELRMYEIAQQELNNDLVILSACETHKGLIIDGEGILSLTRAFQLAGSPNLINTLWAVSDQTAEKIISSYLQKLHHKHNSATSLRLAKLDYLNSSSEYYTHPFFWAAFAYHGQDQQFIFSQMKKNNTYSWMLFCFVSLIVMVLLVLGWRYIIPK